MTLKSGLTVPYGEISCAKTLGRRAFSTGLTPVPAARHQEIIPIKRTQPLLVGGGGLQREKAYKLCKKLQPGGPPKGNLPRSQPTNVAVTNVSGPGTTSVELFGDLHMVSKVLLMNDIWGTVTKACESLKPNKTEQHRPEGTAKPTVLVS